LGNFYRRIFNNSISLKFLGHSENGSSPADTSIRILRHRFRVGGGRGVLLSHKSFVCYICFIYIFLLLSRINRSLRALAGSREALTYLRLMIHARHVILPLRLRCIVSLSLGVAIHVSYRCRIYSSEYKRIPYSTTGCVDTSFNIFFHYSRPFM